MIKNAKIMPQASEITESSTSLLNGGCHFRLFEPEHNNIPASTPMQNTKMSTAKSSLDNNQRTSLFMTYFSDNIPQKNLVKLLNSHYHPTLFRICSLKLTGYMINCTKLQKWKKYHCKKNDD